jgi:Flp pilus assembly protein TadG
MKYLQTQLCCKRNHQRRRGAVAPLLALLLIPLLGMLAFSIDCGWMVLTKTDLQHTADAAALAGAEKLQELYVEYNMPGQLNQAGILKTATTNTPGSPMATAEAFASYNKAGNVSITVPDSDVSFGFTDASGNYTSPYAGFPNTIQVTTRRDATANGSLNLFFGAILGMPTQDLECTARATIYSGTVNTLQVLQGVSAHILPVALDYKVWDQFYATGLSPDGTIHSNAIDGWPELHVYPTPGQAPGNFGLLDIGPPSNYIPAFRNWIDSGATPNDISYLLNNHLLPVSMQAPQWWKCGPGLKNTLISNFESVMWEPNLIPLFQAVQYPSATNNFTYIAASNQGQGAYYDIVGFVGITVSCATKDGINLDISIQPMASVDPTAVLTAPTPAGTQTSPYTPSTSTPTTITTFTSAKLTF